MLGNCAEHEIGSYQRTGKKEQTFTAEKAGHPTANQTHLLFLSLLYLNTANDEICHSEHAVCVVPVTLQDFFSFFFFL